MTTRYFKAIIKILTDNLQDNVQLCLIGDTYQNVYSFLGSDARYLSLAQKIFYHPKNLPFGWETHTLHTSYRCPKGITDFINHCMLKKNFLKPAKEGVPPKYIICNCFSKTTESNKIWNALQEVFSLGYKYSDILILAPSIRKNKAISQTFANVITQYNHSQPKEKQIKLFVPTQEDVTDKEREMEGKLVFLTFHQAKGLERNVVFVLNFDNSYFTYYKKNQNRLKCPNELYVAVSRASERLYLFHHENNDYLPFLDQELIYKYCKIESSQNLDVNEINSGGKTSNFTVTELLRHLPAEVIEEALTFLKIKPINKINQIIKLKSDVIIDEIFESVSEINGTAIPVWYELEIKHKLTVLDQLRNEDLILHYERDNFLTLEQKQFLEECNRNMPNLSISDVLHICSAYNSFLDGYDYKLYQLENYDWLNESKKDIDLLIERLSTKISIDADFEILVEGTIDHPDLGLFTITGSIDVQDANTIYELKCTDELKGEHQLQLALYMYLYQKKEMDEYYSDDDIKSNDEFIFPQFKYILWNILTDEQLEIQSKFSDLEKMVQLLLKRKNECEIPVSDEKFLKNQREAFDLVPKERKELKFTNHKRTKEKSNPSNPISTEINVEKEKINDLLKSEIKVEIKDPNQIIYKQNDRFQNYIFTQLIQTNPNLLKIGKSINDIIDKMVREIPQKIDSAILTRSSEASRIGSKFEITNESKMKWISIFQSILNYFNQLKSGLGNLDSPKLNFLIQFCENILQISRSI